MFPQQPNRKALLLKPAKPRGLNQHLHLLRASKQRGPHSRMK
jgi:hypothetical protein